MADFSDELISRIRPVVISTGDDLLQITVSKLVRYIETWDKPIYIIYSIICIYIILYTEIYLDISIDMYNSKQKESCFPDFCLQTIDLWSFKTIPSRVSHWNPLGPAELPRRLHTWCPCALEHVPAWRSGILLGYTLW